MAVTTWTAGQVLTAADLNDTLASKLDIAGGKIIQIVRATDSTLRSTTSATPVDASLSVTITPQKSNSAILLVHTCVLDASKPTDGPAAEIVLADNSNNALSGAERFGNSLTGGTFIRTAQTAIAHSTPATTSSVTYKVRFQINAATTTASIRNDIATGQLYAIEVSA